MINLPAAGCVTCRNGKPAESIRKSGNDMAFLPHIITRFTANKNRSSLLRGLALAQCDKRALCKFVGVQ